MRDVFKNIPLHKNKEKNRFEIEIDGSFAFIHYKESANEMALLHTEVEPALAGKGAASAVVEKTLIYLKKQDKKILPFCPFIFAFIQKHSEFKDLVDEDFNGYDKL